MAPHRIQWDPEKVARLWDFYARHAAYSQAYFSKVLGGTLLRRIPLPLGEPLRVLDFGCGPGYLFDHLVRLDARWRYTGLDFSADSISALRSRHGGSPLLAGTEQVAALPSALAAESFDAALMVEVVEHLDEAELNGALDEMRRLLRPGGTLIITTPNEEDLAASERLCPECGAIFHVWQHVRSWSEPSLTAALASFGFTPVWTLRDDLHHSGFKGWVKRLAFHLFRRRNKPHLLMAFRRGAEADLRVSPQPETAPVPASR